MLLMGLNIGLVAATIFSVLTSQSIPFVLAVSCGAIGGVTVYSRIRIWRAGKVKLFYDLVRDNEAAAKKMRTFDAGFWAIGVFNLVVCLSSALKGYLSR
jgi:hypothetical protein